MNKVKVKSLAKMHTWTANEYSIRQFIPTDKYLAVFAYDQDGPLRLVAEEIDGIAVARVSEVTREGHLENGMVVDSRVVHRDIHFDIVGVMLSEIGFDVCEENENFTGMIRRGESVETTPSASYSMSAAWRIRLEKAGVVFA